MKQYNFTKVTNYYSLAHAIDPDFVTDVTDLNIATGVIHQGFV